MNLSYSKNFWAISFSLLLFMISFNLILPEMNTYITDIGGEKYKGLIITLFTVSALISRPFSGKLSDKIGRKKVMLLGGGVAVLISMLYPLYPLVFYFLTLRFFHGFSAGFLPTGATAMITDILPAEKRGQGMGIFGVFISLGIGIGQFLSSSIRKEVGINNLFILAAIIAALSVLLIALTKETLKNKKRFRWSVLKIGKEDIFEKSVLPSAIVMFLSATSSGIIFVLVQDISVFLNIENKGWFFGIYVFFTIFVRFFGSGISDKIGRRKTLLIAMNLMIVSMFLLAITSNIEIFGISAIMFGIATGISSPTLFAWMADLSHPDRRGVGSGTLFIALEAGIMLGSLSTLLTYDNTIKSLPEVFGFGIMLLIWAVFYLIWHLKYKVSKT